VLDLIEEFRVPVVDSAIFPLFLEKKLGKRGDFEKIGKNEYQLSAEGKAKVVKAVFDHLNKTVTWKRRRISIKEVIKEQSEHLSRYFLGKESTYTSFDLSLMR
jgi:CRISPR/Cas system-associated endonuclease Cas1